MNIFRYICKMNNIGYCCINLSINENKSKKEQILVNRGMIKKTFESRGLSYVYELAIQNINDMKKILEWNVKNNILVYRMSSDMFPCLGFYKLEDLPNFEVISNKLKSIGDYIKLNELRVGFHPSHFCIIASENDRVIENAIDELNKHAQIMDLMGLDESNYYSINIHIGTTKPTLEEAAKKFCFNFNRLSESCKKRLTVENDDSPNQYSVKMLYDWIYKEISIPIIFDQHHFNYGPKDQTMEEDLKMAHSTWGSIKPLTHMSSPRTIEDSSSKQIAHADYIYEKIETFGLEFDIEIEAKSKDLAVLKYRKDFLLTK
jgi:UV DNA damage endonuclease